DADANFFFFQAEDGIRYRTVTGVQTCALPIWTQRAAAPANSVHDSSGRAASARFDGIKQRRKNAGVVKTFAEAEQGHGNQQSGRSEERRVGKEWRSRRWREQERKKKKRGDKCQ